MKIRQLLSVQAGDGIHLLVEKPNGKQEEIYFPSVGQFELELLAVHCSEELARRRRSLTAGLERIVSRCDLA